MRIAIVTVFLLLCCVAPGNAQQPALKGMSAMEIAEALASPTHAIRERGLRELSLMNADTATALGAEITRMGVREAQLCLSAISHAHSDHAALAACTALDDEDLEVRAGAMDVLIGMHPKHVGAHCDKQLRARREILRKLITEEGYLQRLAEGVKSGEDGKLMKPVEQAMGLMTLYDRHFGVDAMELVVGGFAGYLPGLPDDAEVSPVKRYLNEKLRTGAVLWLEAIWVEDPAIYFNYSPTAPFDDREKAVGRITRKLADMKKARVELGNDRLNPEVFTGIRYGDFLQGHWNNDLLGHRAASYLRLKWWRGDEVIVSGEGYAESVDTILAMRRPEKIRMNRELMDWLVEYRKNTDIK